MYQPFLISGFKTAKSIGMEAWLSPPDAFRVLENMIVNKGVLEKRLGFSEFAQMKHGAVAQTNTAITGIHTFLDKSMPCLLIMDTKRCNFYNPAVSPSTMTDISGNLVDTVIGTDLNEYRCLVSHTSAVNTRPPGGGIYLTVWEATGETGPAETWVVDTDYVAPADIFNGSSSDFFSFINWQGVGYMVNNVDQIHKYEGRGTAVVPFNIKIDADDPLTNQINTCRFMFIKDDRIVLLDTVELGEWNPQRCRYSPVLQTDFSASGGGYVDAPTQERICAAGYVGRNIAVFTQGGDSGALWLIKSTGNNDIPFKWDRVTTTELCRSPYSGVELKDGLAAIGATNIIFYDGFKIKDLDIPHIRDFIEEFDDVRIRCVFGYSQKDKRHLLFTFRRVEWTDAEKAILNSYDTNGDDTIDVFEFLDATNDYSNGILSLKLFLDIVNSFAAGFLIWNFPVMDRILDYNIMENNWTIHRSNKDYFVNCIGGFTGQKVPTGAEFADVVATDIALIPDLTLDARTVYGTPKPYTLIGCRNSRVYKWGDGEFDVDATSSGAISILAESIDLNPFVKEGLKVACEKVGFLVDNDSNASFSVSIYKNTSSTAYKTKIISCDGTNDKFWAWIFCDGEIGTFHKIVISHKWPRYNNTPKIHAFMPYFDSAGRLDAI